MELINAGHLLRQLDGRPSEGMISISAIRAMIDDAPATDAMPEGQWIETKFDGFENGGAISCSNCMFTSFYDFFRTFRFCPMCGSRMEQKE